MNTICSGKYIHHMCAHMYPCFWFLPCVVSEYCKRLGQRRAKTVTYYQTGPRLTPRSHQDETPREHCAPGQRSWASVKVGETPVCLPTAPQAGPLGWGRWGITGRGPAPSSLSVIQPEVSGPHASAAPKVGVSREGQTRGRGGIKNNSRRISSVQYGPFESLLLQYTLTKIESHFISIQQQQKEQFPGLLHC